MAGASVSSPTEFQATDQQPSVNIQDRKRAARFWAERTGPYKESVAWRSVVQLVNTLVPLAALFVLMGLSLKVGYWLTLLLAVPAGLVLMRLWVLAHDCGHGSFFASNRGNAWVGRFIGVLTITPYEVWRRDHATHHATSGNLDKRGTGDIDTLTVREYLALSPMGRLRYRVYRHPLVLFGVGPIVLFFWKFRFPLTGQERDPKAWISAMGTTAASIAAISLIGSVVGLDTVLKVWLPTMFVAGSFGIFVFYMQHQFETVYWRHEPEWDYYEAAIHGCSFFDLPRWMHWLTGNIGYHHVHHLASRIPNYRLRACHEAVPELHAVKPLTFLDSLKTIRLALFDEESKRLIGFGELKAHVA